MSTDNHGPHWIDLEGAVNARAVVPGVLLRSDNLQSLSEQDVAVLVQDEGVEAVIDLRTEVELELEGPGPMTREPAVRIEHRSLYPESGGNTDLEADTVRPWKDNDELESPQESPVVRAYMGYLRRRPDSVVGSIQTIARADKAVLSCTAPPARIAPAWSSRSRSTRPGSIATQSLPTTSRPGSGSRGSWRA